MNSPGNALLSDPSKTALLLRAVDFAARKHTGQLRKDGLGTPYINHPIGVASLIANDAGCPDNIRVLCAAVLHDVVEDTATTLEEVSELFGAEVASLVAEVTDEKGQPRHVRRKTRIETARHLTPGARLILLADKLYNCRDCIQCKPPSWSEADVRGYLEWVAEVVREIRGSNERLEQLLAEALANVGVTL